MQHGKLINCLPERARLLAENWPLEISHIVIPNFHLIWNGEITLKGKQRQYFDFLFHSKLTPYTTENVDILTSISCFFSFPVYQDQIHYFSRASLQIRLHSHC